MPTYRQEEYESGPQYRSLGGLITDLTGQIGLLVRKEAELARAEMTHNASVIVRNAVLMGVGGVLLYAGLMVLLAAAVFGLSYWVAAWLAALIVAAAVLSIGAVVFLSGRNRLRYSKITPNQTITSIKENTKWLKQRT